MLSPKTLQFILLRMKSAHIVLWKIITMGCNEPCKDCMLTFPVVSIWHVFGLNMFTHRGGVTESLHDFVFVALLNSLAQPEPEGNFLTCYHPPGLERCYEELHLNELLWLSGAWDAWETSMRKRKLRDVISSPELVCCFLVALAYKQCVEETQKKKSPQERKTTQTMICSSLTKHLSDIDG